MAENPNPRPVAQLVAATLARLYGRPADSFSWSYIAMYAQSNSPQMVGRLCMRVLDKTKKVLGFNLHTQLSPIADIIHIRLSPFFGPVFPVLSAATHANR